MCAWASASYVLIWERSELARNSDERGRRGHSQFTASLRSVDRCGTELMNALIGIINFVITKCLNIVKRVLYRM